MHLRQLRCIFLTYYISLINYNRFIEAVKHIYPNNTSLNTNTAIFKKISQNEAFQGMNKAIYFICIYLFFQTEVFAQRFFSVVFNQLPKDFQLYARDDQNQATVPISGKIELAGWSYFSTIVYRNNLRVGYVRENIKYSGTTATVGSFEMSPKIKAELADYSLEVYACRNSSDSVQIVRRNDLVAGDFYVIQGQSNAAAILSYPNYSNKYCRTIGRQPDGVPNFKSEDTLWRSQEWVTPEVGYWGRELSKLIVEQHKIPVCIINGAIPGKTIEQHSDRNNTTPADPNTLYGHLLYRVNKSGATRIRAFFFYQGEDDALRSIGGYGAKFDKLHTYWQADFPTVDKFVIFQINLLFTPFYEAGAIRNIQRTAKTIYPKTDHVGTIGLPPPPDGVHYTEGGYKVLAERTFKFIGPHFYGVKPDQPFRYPDVQKIFYTNAQKNAIKLLFDEGQNLVWGNDTTFTNAQNQSIIRRLKDQFFLDGNESKPAPISSWSIQNNQLILNLSESSTATKINYLPSYSQDTYIGPYLKNQLGWGALSFHEVAIKNALEIQDFKATPTALDKIALQWKSVSGASSLVIKRRKGNEAGVIIKELKGDVTSFEDIALTPSTDYSYQIQAISADSESPIYTADARTFTVLSTIPVTAPWQIYPIPVQNELTIDFSQYTTGTLRLIDLIGKVYIVQELTNQNHCQLLLNNCPPGTYFILFDKYSGNVLRQRIVKY